ALVHRSHPFVASCHSSRPRYQADVTSEKENTMTATESRGASTAEAKRELGWELRYPSWRDGFSAAYAPAERSEPDPTARAGSIAVSTFHVSNQEGSLVRLFG